MSITSEITRIKTNISNAYTELKNKNATIPSVENSEGLASSIASIQTGGGEPITKGIIINECDSDGYATDVSIVGMTKIPNYYFYYAAATPTSSTYAWMSKVGNNLHLPNNLTEIGDSAFYQCPGIAIDKLPDSVTIIDKYAFYGCSNLALTSLPENLVRINERAFYNAINLPLKSLPKKLGIIDTYAFYGCSYNLDFEEIPDNVAIINSHAFYACVNLKLKSVSRNVTTLSYYTFYNCRAITELTCKGNLTSIGTYVFYNCSNLTKLILPNITSVPQLQGTNAFTGTPIASGTGYIYVPDNLVASFQSASNWSTYASQIKGVSEL